LPSVGLRRHATIVTSCVLDASALIAFLFQEPGADFVAPRIAGALMTAVNYSEVIARALEKRMPMSIVEPELARLPLIVVPFDATLARLTASLKAPTRAIGLSLADRACLALSLHKNLPVVTGDRDWLKAGLPVEIEMFR
jgi:ribonuclease VapC